MSLAPLVIAAATESASGSGGINHWVVGGIVFLLFLAMMGGLLAFGGGREHS